MEWPFPEGTVVTGRIPDLGLPARESCRDHLFRTEGDAFREWWGGEPHWLQAARCLACGVVTQPIDAEFWSELATPDDKEKFRAAVKREVDRLNVVLDGLDGVAVAPRFNPSVLR